MLEEMFGERPLMDHEELLTSEVKAKFEAACQTEGEVMKAEGKMDPEHKVTVVKAASLPIGVDFGIHPYLFLESVPVPGKSAKIGKSVTKLYYHCKICKAHSNQNWPSMSVHTCRCLKLKIVCPLCSATYDSSDNLQNHIVKTHGEKLEAGE